MITSPAWLKEHDAAIRKDEREKILKAVTKLFCIQKDSEAWRWLETLRKQEQPK
jgi:hypothetical protein